MLELCDACGNLALPDHACAGVGAPIVQPSLELDDVRVPTVPPARSLPPAAPATPSFVPPEPRVETPIRSLPPNASHPPVSGKPARVWRWSVAATEIVATLDASGVESVRVGPRIVSRSGPAGKAEGHAFVVPSAGTYRTAAPVEGRVQFDRRRATCALLVQGNLVPLLEAPAAPPPLAQDPSPATRLPTVIHLGWPLKIAAAVGVLLAIGAGSMVLLPRVLNKAMTTRFEARPVPDPYGNFVAMVPARFGTRITVGGAVFLHPHDHPDVAIGWIDHQATDRNGNLEAMAAASRTYRLEHELKAFTFTETERRRQSCRGDASEGIVVSGALVTPQTKGKAYFCTVVKRERAKGTAHFFSFAYVVVDGADEDEAALGHFVHRSRLIDVNDCNDRGCRMEEPGQAP